MNNALLNSELVYLPEGYLGFKNTDSQIISWPSSNNFFLFCTKEWYPFVATPSFKRVKLESSFRILSKLVEKKYLKLSVGNFIELVHQVADIL